MSTQPVTPSPATLIDHPIKGSLAGAGVRMGFVLGVVGLFFFLIFLAVGATAGLGWPRWTGPAILFTGLAGFLAVNQIRSSRKIKRRLSQITPEESPVAILADLIKPTGGMSAVQAVSELVKSLGQQQRGGTTIRICPSDMAVAIDPLNIPFEPLPLENLDATLADAGTREPTSDLDRGDAPKAPAEATEGWRYIRRNIAIKGGWFIVVVFGFNGVTSAIEAYSAGRFTLRLGMWLSLLLIILLLPARYGRAGSGQWLAVPGGIITRKAKWNSKTWTLHLFTRMTSVLCVYRISRESWGLALADKDDFARAVATRTEVQTLLRVWTSDLSPPPMDQLTDLT